MLPLTAKTRMVGVLVGAAIAGDGRDRLGRRAGDPDRARTPR